MQTGNFRQFYSIYCDSMERNKRGIKAKVHNVYTTALVRSLPLPLSLPLSHSHHLTFVCLAGPALRFAFAFWTATAPFSASVTGSGCPPMHNFPVLGCEQLGPLSMLLLQSVNRRRAAFTHTQREQRKMEIVCGRGKRCILLLFCFKCVLLRLMDVVLHTRPRVAQAVYGCSI